MFALKEYALDHIGKKRMPICRICDPPKGFTNWTVFNAHQVHRHGGLDKYKCHYEGCTKELKSLLGFQNHIFYHEEDKKSGSVTYVNKNSLLSHNCQGTNLPIQIGNHLNVQVRLVPNSKKGLRVNRL